MKASIKNKGNVINIIRLFAGLLLFGSLFFGVQTVKPVDAQEYSAHDLINAVNVFRANYDLEPYKLDESLMAIAQEHSEYQASIETRTHTRADGTGPEAYGISSENIGSGAGVSPDDLIYIQWTDYWHTHTLIGYTTGLIGAGVAEVNGVLYYTLDIRNTGEQTGLPGQETVPTAGTAVTSDPSIPTNEKTIEVHTVTPQADGALVHIVQPGETVWLIALAYGVTIQEIADLNGLDAERPLIYPNDTLYINQAFTETPTPTITNTPLPPTRTLRPSRTPQDTGTPVPEAALIDLTPSPILLPENTYINEDNLNVLGYIILGITIIGIIAVVTSRLWSKNS